MSSTILLLHCDGSNNSTSFIDQSTYKHSMTAVGNAQVDTSQSKFGGGSLLLDGNGDYLSSPDSEDWNFGANDFTLEFFARFPSVPGAGQYPTFLAQWNSNNQEAWEFLYDGDNSALEFGYTTDGSTEDFPLKAWTPLINTWYHIAVSRNSTGLRFFVDGVQQGTTSINTNGKTIFNSNSILTIGTDLLNGSPVLADTFNGRLDEIRISNVARYTSNFTAPTAPFSLYPSNFNGYVWKEVSRSTR